MNSRQIDKVGISLNRDCSEVSDQNVVEVLSQISRKLDALISARPSSGWLSVSQVAEELGVSRKTVLRRLRRGELPGKKLGSRWRIPRAELERMFESTNVPVDAEIDVSARAIKILDGGKKE